MNDNQLWKLKMAIIECSLLDSKESKQFTFPDKFQ